jgi:hypothetical protein
MLVTHNKALYDSIQDFCMPDNRTKIVLKSGRTPAQIGVMDAIVLLMKLDIIDEVIDKNLASFEVYKKAFEERNITFPDLDLKNTKPHIRHVCVMSQNSDLYMKNGF